MNVLIKIMVLGVLVVLSGCNKTNPLEKPDEAKWIQKIKEKNPNWIANKDTFSFISRKEGLNIYISGKGITDLSALSRMDIDTVFLIDTNLKNLDFLENSKSLRILAISNSADNRIKLDIRKLNSNKLERFTSINVDILSFDSIYGAPFQRLGFSNVKTISQRDFDLLSNLKNLRTLRIQDMNIENLNFLKNSKELYYINIEGTKIRDLSPLYGKTLQVLDIARTPAAENKVPQEIRILPQQLSAEAEKSKAGSDSINGASHGK